MVGLVGGGVVSSFRARLSKYVPANHSEEMKKVQEEEGKGKKGGGGADDTLFKV